MHIIKKQIVLEKFEKILMLFSFLNTYNNNNVFLSKIFIFNRRTKL
jgi:hypothetical protein